MSSRKDAICFKDYNEALAERPETYGRIDLLCGGWPCQDNSIAGSRKGHAGEKSGLFSEFYRVLRVFNPCWFVAENVPGLLSVNAGKDFCEVLSILQDIGYGISWRILDSQYFGVAQQRRRLFIVGYFGNPCPPEILFECQSDTGNYPQKQEMGKVGLCISTRDGQRQDPSTENIVASTVGTTDAYRANTRTRRNQIVSFTLGTDQRGNPFKLHTETLCATTVRTQEAGNRIQGNIATTIDAQREGETTGISYELDASRGVIIGNAVTVNVAEWIGKRIVAYEKGEIKCSKEQ